MNSLLIELQYLPSVAFFQYAAAYGELHLEAQEHYQRQSYRNRCHVLTANGPKALMVPVLHDNGKTAIKDVKIDYSQKWVNQHWRTLVAAYAKAPYFEYFADYFDQIYQQQPAFLFDLNLQLLTRCLQLLQLNPTIRQTTQYESLPSNGQFDARNLIHPKKSLPNNLLNAQHAYKQNFGNDFEANLSIVDLLMCQGPKAKQFLNQL
jgi:WbqC-like protein family